MCLLAQQGQTLREGAGSLQRPMVQGSRNGQGQPLKTQALWRHIELVGHLGDFVAQQVVGDERAPYFLAHQLRQFASQSRRFFSIPCFISLKPNSISHRCT